MLVWAFSSPDSRSDLCLWEINGVHSSTHCAWPNPVPPCQLTGRIDVYKPAFCLLLRTSANIWISVLCSMKTPWIFITRLTYSGVCSYIAVFLETQSAQCDLWSPKILKTVAMSCKSDFKRKKKKHVTCLTDIPCCSNTWHYVLPVWDENRHHTKWDLVLCLLLCAWRKNMLLLCFLSSPRRNKWIKMNKKLCAVWDNTGRATMSCFTPIHRAIWTGQSNFFFFFWPAGERLCELSWFWGCTENN